MSEKGNCISLLVTTWRTQRCIFAVRGSRTVEGRFSGVQLQDNGLLRQTERHFRSSVAVSVSKFHILLTVCCIRNSSVEGKKAHRSHVKHPVIDFFIMCPRFVDVGDTEQKNVNIL